MISPDALRHGEIVKLTRPGPVRFSRVERLPRLSDRVAAQLAEAIGAGRFRDGDVIPSERGLGDQFGVSRTVIREAIRALIARGVLESEPGRGVRVTRRDATTSPLDERPRP